MSRQTDSPSSRGSPPTSVRYQVLLALLLAAALAYLLRNSVGVAESTIREELGLTKVQSGWFMGAFFWTYALFQVPAGWLAQQHGTRIGLVGFSVAWSLAGLMIGVAPGFWLLVLAQMLMGIAQAGLFPASCNTVAHWMPIDQRSFACGVLAIGMQVGAIVAGTLTGNLMLAIPWRWVFVLYALPSLMWAIGFWYSFRNHPDQHPWVNASERERITGRLATTSESTSTSVRPDVPEIGLEPSTPWRAILSNPTVWFLCGQQMARASGYMFFASWFPTFLQKTRGVSVAESGYLQALVFSGTLIGSLLGGWLTDFIWKRTRSLRWSRGGVGAVFLLGCSLLILASWFVSNVPIAIGLLTLGSVFAALAGPCGYSACIDIGGRHVPQVFGLMNMSGNLAAAACPILVAGLFEWTANWDLVLVLFALVYFAGSIFWILVKPDRGVAISAQA